MKLLVDNNGEKMGKTTGNMLSFLDSADEKFKKIMTWSDGMIYNVFELLTDTDLDTIQTRLDSDENPRDIKFDLAHTIVSRFHSEDEATAAKESWVNDVQKDNKPADIPEIDLLADTITTLQKATGVSKSQLKRLFNEGAIRVNGQKKDNEHFILNREDLIQIGKKRWFSIK